MSWIEVRNRPAEYVNVTKILNFYVATHTKGTEKTFLMRQLVADLNIAKVTAKSFSRKSNIPYISKFDEEKRPIFTVLRYGEEWFPAELQIDKTLLLTGDKSRHPAELHLGGDQAGAILVANVIALTQNGLCFPNIGIALGNQMRHEFENK